MSPPEKHILKTVFGYDEFRPLQAEIISHALQKKDTLVVMPTGGGKSLCYQIPALIFPGLTIVVSPLISLMQDQVEQLQDLKLPAVVLNSSLDTLEYRRNLNLLQEKKVKLLFLAPETLLKPNIVETLSRLDIDCLAIDEAHCISDWGHDFRPEYRQLIELRKRFSMAACMALTATATPRVQKDIKSMLGFDASDEFIGSFDRPNLFLEVKPKVNPFDQARNLMDKFAGQSGIIYCATRNQVDTLYEKLEMKGYSVLPYHAGMDEADRKLNQQKFIKDDVQVIVATIAFGMGIDKPNIRYVIHYDLPKNIESYYQEIGRAGRDGVNAHCLLLFSYADIHKIRYFIDQKSEQEKRVANLQLKALMTMVETDGCRRIPLMTYFGEPFDSEDCGMCDNCTTRQEDLDDVTIHAQKFLSCVKRTDERFGAAYIVDVLRGSNAQRIKKFGHHELSTYGIGLECTKKEWLLLSNQFIQRGLLIQDMEYGSLKLTEKAWEVLRGKRKVFARLKIQDEPPEAELEAKPETRSAKKTDIPVDYDHALFEILRIKRKELADLSDFPPYVVFSDRSLIEMSAFFPQTPENLLKIQGVGDVKLEKYGEIFLDLIRKYCRENGIEERPLRKSAKPSAPSSKPASAKKQRHVEVGEMFNEGKTIPEIMNFFQVKQTTVTNHLHKYILEGFPIEPERAEAILSLSALDSDYKEMIGDLFGELGTERLGPVYEALGKSVHFDELHLLRLHYLITDSS